MQGQVADKAGAPSRVLTTDSTRLGVLRARLAFAGCCKGAQAFEGRAVLPSAEE